MGRIADTFRIEMQRDLYKSYKKIYESGECETQYQAIDKARKSPAPQFYTTSKNCCYIITLMAQGRDTGLRNPDKIRKFQEIKRRVDEWKTSGREYPGLRNVCREIVEQPAPEYYICYNTAKQMIMDERRKEKEEKMRWVKR